MIDYTQTFNIILQNPGFQSAADLDILPTFALVCEAFHQHIHSDNAHWTHIEKTLDVDVTNLKSIQQFMICDLGISFSGTEKKSWPKYLTVQSLQNVWDARDTLRFWKILDYYGQIDVMYDYKCPVTPEEPNTANDYINEMDKFEIWFQNNEIFLKMPSGSFIRDTGIAIQNIFDPSPLKSACLNEFGICYYLTIA